MSSLTLVDVREADEVAAGMIPGAIHIPLGDVPVRMGELIDLSHIYSFVVQAVVAGVQQSSLG